MPLILTELYLVACYAKAPIDETAVTAEVAIGASEAGGSLCKP